MKKRWVEPRVQVEEFMPNEYVAVCWGVQCSIDPANAYEETVPAYCDGQGKHRPHQSNNYHVGQTHRTEYCGTLGHQWLVDSDGNNVPENMYEISTDGLGNLACTLYTDGSYSNVLDISAVRAGDYIYWTTSSGNRTWHHQGRVTGTTPGHPNRS